jgi:hypothetical protein
MDSYTFWVFAHVLILVFWLGTDVGVFLAAKLSERSDLSVETRSTVLKLGMVLDRLPRSALTLIFPTGLELATAMQLLSLPGFVLPLVWVVSLAWLAILWLGFLKPETAVEKKAMLFNFAMNVLAAVVVLVYATYLFTGTDTPTWLALKITATGLVFVTGVLLDVLFKPAVEAFMAIIIEGATPERDRRYSKAISPVYTAVLAIYALVLFSTYMGIAKPF